MIQCDCSVDVDEYPSFYLQVFRKARKEHKCCECGETIKSGERYEETTGCWEGDPDRFRTCIPCSNIRDHYCPHGYNHGELRERIKDCLGFDYVTYPDGSEGEDEDYEERWRKRWAS